MLFFWFGNSVCHLSPIFLFKEGHVIDLRAQARYRRQGSEWDPITVVDYLELPGMEVECRHCGAILFRGEPEGICCLKGTIVLPHVVDAPEPLTLAFTLSFLWPLLITIPFSFAKIIKSHQTCFMVFCATTGPQAIMMGGKGFGSISAV